MARLTGFIFQDKYLERLKKLSDQEVGRLVRALAVYHATGEEQELKGRECGYYDFIKGDIDEIENHYAAKCEKNRQNRLTTNVDERERTITNVDERTQNKNIKEKEKINNKVSNETYMREFEVFWAAYPRHTGKQDAYKAFVKLKPDEALMAAILAGIEKQKQSAQWTKDGGQFIPHPATWLNGCRWEDELPKNVPKWANDASHGYTQREYQPGELDAIGDDLMEEARKYRGHTA